MQQIEAIVFLQALAKKYAAIEKGSEFNFDSREQIIARELSKQLDKTTKIEDVIEELERRYPQLADELENLKNSVNTNKTISISE